MKMLFIVFLAVFCFAFTSASSFERSNLPSNTPSGSPYLAQWYSPSSSQYCGHRFEEYAKSSPCLESCTSQYCANTGHFGCYCKAGYCRDNSNGQCIQDTQINSRINAYPDVYEQESSPSVF